MAIGSNSASCCGLRALAIGATTTGRVHLPGEPGYEALLERCAFAEPSVPAARRSIVEIGITRVSDSCGYGVPLMSYEGEREHARLWAEKRLRAQGPHAMAAYQAEKNSRSLDGLPAVPAPS